MYTAFKAFSARFSEHTVYFIINNHITFFISMLKIPSLKDFKDNLAE